MPVKLPFGRSSAEATPAPVVKEGGKGRATPSRKTAQAAAKERAKVGGGDKKAAQKLLRERQATANKTAREGMRNGDERYMMERDKGPVRRYVRDFVDTRWAFMEYLLPLLIVIMVLQYTGAQAISVVLWEASVVLLIVDVLWMNFSLGRQIKQRFPDENVRGWRFYAFMRAIQLRVLRMPKPQFKHGQKLPDTYR